MARHCKLVGEEDRIPHLAVSRLTLDKNLGVSVALHEIGAIALRGQQTVYRDVKALKVGVGMLGNKVAVLDVPPDGSTPNLT